MAVPLFLSEQFGRLAYSRQREESCQLLTEGLLCPRAQVGSGETTGVDLLGEQSSAGGGAVCLGLIVFLHGGWESPIVALALRCPVNQFN